MRKPVPTISRAGRVVGEALHSAGDAVGSLAEQAQSRADWAADALRSGSRQVLPNIHGVRDNVYEAGRRITRSVTRQPDDPMLWALLTGVVVGYLAGWLIHRR